MKKRKNKIPGKIGIRQLSPHVIQRMKERGISTLEIEKALKHGEIEDSILRYKHLEIVLSDDNSKMVTAWNNGKEESSTVISKKDKQMLSSKISENKKTKKTPEPKKVVEFTSYEDYLNFLKSKR
jgi:DNA-binding transcriptional MerR regulator